MSAELMIDCGSLWWADIKRTNKCDYYTYVVVKLALLASRYSSSSVHHRSGLVVMSRGLQFRVVSRSSIYNL